jgi:hypothetical protein
MFKMLKPVALVSLMLIAGSASAAKIEFESLTKNPIDTYKESGYVVKATKGNNLEGVKTTDWELYTAGFTFQATAGNKNQDFDLDSFYLDFGTALDVRLTYTVDGEAKQTIDLGDTSSSLFTVNKNDVFKFTGLDDLSSFSLQAINLKGKVVSDVFAADSIKVTPDVAAVAVPEPGSLALMLAGLGIVGTLARRRRS